MGTNGTQGTFIETLIIGTALLMPWEFSHILDAQILSANFKDFELIPYSALDNVVKLDSEGSFSEPIVEMPLVRTMKIKIKKPARLEMENIQDLKGFYS